MSPERQVVVAGAGLTGSALAVALAARGLAVTVVERRQPLLERLPDVRGLVLSAASRTVLEGLGLWSRLAPHATAVTRIHVAEQGRFGSVVLDAAESGRAALGWACPADVMLAEFHAALLDMDGVTVCWGADFVDARVRGGEIEVRFGTGDDTRAVTAALLVGADGAESTVRAGAGIALTAHDYAQQAIVANVEVTRPQAGLAYEYFTAEGPLAMIPRGGASYVSVQCLGVAQADAALQLDDAAYASLLERRFGRRLGAIVGVGPRRAHALRRQRAQALAATRTVLIGNAANTVHPNGAQGLNLGLRDVATLADLLGQAPDAGDAGVLAAYAGARARDHRLVGGFTHLLATGFTSPLGAARCVRHGALGALSLVAPLRRRLVAGLGGVGRLPPGVGEFELPA
ncbi:MAG: FAD-dependent monooxygenase [Gammaproteobacteria bacterium]